MNSGGFNDVYETQIFLVEQTVLVNSARSTTLCCKRELRWTGLAESVLLKFIQILSSYGCCKRIQVDWLCRDCCIGVYTDCLLCQYCGGDTLG